jgi:TRAP-type C4-dicarboxylate transport system substrate-binding protein
MIITRAVLVAGVCALAASPVSAETFKWTVVAAPPPTVTPTQITKEFFVPEVSKRVEAAGKGDKIEWTEAYSQTLAKFTETLETVEEGIAQVGVQIKLFEEAKLPLEQYAASIPFGPADMTKLLQIDKKVRTQVPEMNAMFLKYNQVAIANASEISMQMFTKFPLTKMDDLKGHKIGASGTLAQLLRGTGAVAVTASMQSAYTDLTNGLYEGYTTGESLAFPYKIYQAAPYFTKTDFGGTMTAALTVNKKTWDALPDYIRTILSDVAKEWELKYIQVSEGKNKAMTDLMMKEGLKASVMSAEERKKWAMAMPNVAKEWAAAVDKQGLPGTKVLVAFMNEMRASGEPVLRNWDRE